MCEDSNYALVMNVLGICMDPFVKLGGGGQGHDDQEKENHDGSQGPGWATAGTKDFPNPAHYHGYALNALRCQLFTFALDSVFLFDAMSSIGCLVQLPTRAVCLDPKRFP